MPATINSVIKNAPFYAIWPLWLPYSLAYYCRRGPTIYDSKINITTKKVTKIQNIL